MLIDNLKLSKNNNVLKLESINEINIQFDNLYNEFHAEIIPSFFRLFEKLINFPNDISSHELKYYIKYINYHKKINKKNSNENKKYFLKLLKCNYFLFIKVKDLEYLFNKNIDFKYYTRKQKFYIENIYLFGYELLKIYDMELFDSYGNLNDEFKNRLNTMEFVMDEII